VKKIIKGIRGYPSGERPTLGVGVEEKLTGGGRRFGKAKTPHQTRVESLWGMEDEGGRGKRGQNKAGAKNL